MHGVNVRKRNTIFVLICGVIIQDLNAARYLIPGWAITDDSIEWSAQIIAPKSKNVDLPLHRIILKGARDTAAEIKKILDAGKKNYGTGTVVFKEDGTVNFDAMTPGSPSYLVVQADDYGLTALHYAAYLGYKYVIDILLSYCDQSQTTHIINVVDKYGRAPLLWAINHESQAEPLLADFLKQLSQEKRAEYTKVTNNISQHVENLIKPHLGSDYTTFYAQLQSILGGEPRVSDNDMQKLGAVPEQMIDFLVSKGANLIARDNAGRTPLHWAVIYLKRDIVDILIAKLKSTPSNLDVGDYVGATPLHYVSALRYVLDNEKAAEAKTMQGSMISVSPTAVRTGVIAQLAKNISTPQAFALIGATSLSIMSEKVAHLAAEVQRGVRLLGEDLRELVSISGSQGIKVPESIMMASQGKKATQLVKLEDLVSWQNDLNAVRTTQQTTAAIGVETFIQARMFALGISLLTFAVTTIALELLMHYIINPELKKLSQQNVRNEIHKERDKIIEALSNAGANILAADKNKRIPLHYAAAMGNHSVIKFLVGKSSNSISAADKDGLLPAHFAALSVFVQGVKDSLVLFGDTVHAVSKNGLTPLLCAINSGSYEVIDLLIEGSSFPAINYVIPGASLDELYPRPKADGTGEKTVLHYLVMQVGGLRPMRSKAEEAGKLEDTIRALANRLDDFKGSERSFSMMVKQKDTYGRTPLHYLAANDNDYNDKLFTSLVKRAVGSENIEKSETYLKTQIGTDNNGNTLLHMACASGREKLAKDLVDMYHFDPNQSNNAIKDDQGRELMPARTPIVIARDSGFPAIVEFLAKRTDMKKSEQKELMQEAKVTHKIGVKEEKLERVETKMEEKVAKKEHKIEEKAAKKRWDEEEQKDRLEKQTKMKKLEKKQEAAAEPLFIQAARTDDRKVIDAMIRQKTDIAVVDEAGKTALMQAAEKGHKVMVEKILNAYTEKDAQGVPYISQEAVRAMMLMQDKYGNNALIVAVAKGNEDVIKAVVQAADTHGIKATLKGMKNEKGKDVYGYAKDHGKKKTKDIEKLLN